MNLESEFKTDLVNQCRKLGAYARRLEDRYAIGLLDLTIKFPDLPHLFAEGKVVPHQAFGPTKRQFEEGRRYIAAGGVCALLGWDKATGRLFIHPWAEQAHKADAWPSGGSFRPNNAEALREWLKWQTIKPSSPTLEQPPKR